MTKLFLTLGLLVAPICQAQTAGSTLRALTDCGKMASLGKIGELDGKEFTANNLFNAAERDFSAIGAAAASARRAECDKVKLKVESYQDLSLEISGMAQRLLPAVQKLEDENCHKEISNDLKLLVAATNQLRQKYRSLCSGEAGR